MPKKKSVGFIIKRRVPEASRLAEEAAVFLKQKGCRTLFLKDDRKTAAKTGSGLTQTKEELIQKSDFIVVFGGDGTFISIARNMARHTTPVLGVNMGQLGFLTEVKKSEIFDTLEAALAGQLKSSPRTMMECQLIRAGKVLAKLPVVNDVVLSQGSIARIFDLDVLVDKHLVTRMRADGIIVSTPTGSTAYCLAAGGPVVQPTVPAFVLVPICPHALTLRPLVVSDESEITLEPRLKENPIILTLDGQVSFSVKAGDRVRITRFKKHKLEVLQSNERDYFALIREKLSYGYRG
jgi:NAD+ kinase